jgi:anti-sigma factor RsiW
LSWLSGRLGHKLMIPNLKGAGFKLMGGRLVADKGDPAALFMFEDGKARRVSLYVRPGMGGGNTKFRVIAEHGMVAFYWTNGQLTYALSGEMAQGDLLSLVQMVHDDLTSRSS